MGTAQERRPVATNLVGMLRVLPSLLSLALVGGVTADAGSPRRGWPSGASTAVAALERLIDSRADAKAWSEAQGEVITATPSELRNVSPIGAGDFDGDGKDDVLSIESSGPSGDFPLVARRGTDGTALWATRAQFAAPIDFAADRRPEVLATTILPAADGSEALRQTLVVYSGGGAELWRTVIDARFTDLGVTDYLVTAQRMPDATGDGVGELFVGTLDWSDPALRFTARVFDGVRGNEHGRLSVDAVAGLPWIAPTPDRDGDGLADTVALSPAADVTAVLSAHSGTSAEPAWRALAASGDSLMSVRELDGDGVPDVVLQSHEWVGGPSASGYSGRDGSLLWLRPLGDYTAVAGDIDGDGANDDIDVTALAVDALRLDAWSGRTGGRLWSATYTAAPGTGRGVVEFCRCPADLSGDGVWDPMVAQSLFGPGGRESLVVLALDGRDGSVRWRAEQLDHPWQLPVPIGHDANEDGAGDLVSDLSVSEDVLLSVRDGRNFDEVFAAERVSASGSTAVLARFGADLTGSAASELVFSVSRFDGVRRSVTAHAHSSSGPVWDLP